MKILENYTSEMKLRRYSENSIKVYTGCFKIFVEYYQGEDIRYVSEEKIKAFLKMMVDRNKISSSYQNQLINSIKFYYEKILHLPRKTYFIDRPRKESKIPIILSQDEVRRIFKECTYLKHRAILQLIYSAGLRESEVIHLKVSNIDSESMVIHVQQAKGNKDRTAPLSIRTRDILRQYYKSLPVKPKTYLFAGQFGELYSASSIRQFLNKYAEQAGIKKNVFPHLLRHCFATHAHDAGTDIYMLQKVLGHKHIKTTQRYTHLSTESIAGMGTPDMNL